MIVSVCEVLWKLNSDNTPVPPLVPGQFLGLVSIHDIMPIFGRTTLILINLRYFSDNVYIGRGSFIFADMLVYRACQASKYEELPVLTLTSH